MELIRWCQGQKLQPLPEDKWASHFNDSPPRCLQTFWGFWGVCRIDKVFAEAFKPFHSKVLCLKAQPSHVLSGVASTDQIPNLVQLSPITIEIFNQGGMFTHARKNGLKHHRVSVDECLFATEGFKIKNFVEGTKRSGSCDKDFSSNIKLNDTILDFC